MGQHAIGIAHARMRGGRTADDTPQVRAGHVRAALQVVVASLALDEGLGAGIDIGGGQHRTPVGRRVDDFGGARVGGVGDLDRIAGPGGGLEAVDGVRADAHAHDHQNSDQARTQDLVSRQIVAHVA